MPAVQQRYEPVTIVKSKVKPLTAEQRCHRAKLLNKLGIEKGSACSSSGTQLPANREPSRGSLLGRVQSTTERLKYDENFHQTFLEKQTRAMKRSTSADSLFSAFSSIFSGTSPPHEETTPLPSTLQEQPPTASTSRGDKESVPTSPFVSETETESSISSTASISSSSNTNKRRGISFNDEVTVVPIPMRGEYSKRIRDRLWVGARELQSQVERNTVEFASEGWDWKNAFEDDEMFVCAVSGEKVHPVHCQFQE